MDYKYSRELNADGYYNINNPFDVNEVGKSVTLYSRIAAALPEKNLKDVLLKEDVAIVVIDELKIEDKTILDETVAAHKAADGSINYQTELHLTSSDGKKWDIYIENDGTLKTQLSDE